MPGARATNLALDVLLAAGEMGELVRSLDWSATPLGWAARELPTHHAPAVATPAMMTPAISGERRPPGGGEVAGTYKRPESDSSFNSSSATCKSAMF
jgi:hypothetical protein